MTQTNTRPNASRLGLMFLLAAVCVTGCARKEQAHASFDSAEAAVTAFIEAVERDDTAAMQKLLGPGSEDLVSSGDALQDQGDRAEFVASYRRSNKLVAAGDDTMTLVMGENEWPFPVPVVKGDGGWYLDGAQGVDELVYRRIGANELGAIAVSRGFVEAQREYAASGHDGDPAGIYALKLVSDEGLQNGLYWPTAEGEEPSPAGEFVASAAGEGYRASAGTPYHGYRYRMLYRQGGNSNGGAREYFKNGVLTEGFALVAWPAEYGASGVMTFIVNQDGVVFQKDLGEGTEAAVAAMGTFDHDSSWTAVTEADTDNAES
jgi:hypothetical protein